MFLAVFYGLITFCGFYLVIKCLISRKRGIHLEGRLVGFQDEEGEAVKIIFDPKNRKFVDLEGSATEYIYGIAAIVLGGFLLFYQLKKLGLF